MDVRSLCPSIPHNEGIAATKKRGQCHTSETSRFVDQHLRPVVKQFPSYIKDTNHIINKVNNFSVPVNSILVTMDVRSLCPSIPHNEGIAATKKRGQCHTSETSRFVDQHLRPW